MLPACDRCGVEYVEGYEGSCLEWLPSATEEQILRGDPPMCRGTVGIATTADRKIAELTRERDRLKVFARFVSDLDEPSSSEIRRSITLTRLIEKANAALSREAV